MSEAKTVITAQEVAGVLASSWCFSMGPTASQPKESRFEIITTDTGQRFHVTVNEIKDAE